MAMIVSFLNVLILISLFSNLFTKATDFNYPAIFNFGDSNSDTGGLVAGLAFHVDFPNGQTYFQKPAGRLCDGRLIIDFLMEALDLPFLNPYLDSVGLPSFRCGCNFATGGSTILAANAASISPFSFGIQVAQFLHFKARVLELLAKGKRFEKFLPQEDYFKEGLYMFDIGQNDLDGAFSSSSEDQVLALIPTLLSELEAGLKKLYDEGAKKFWIHNIGPLGCLPRIIATFGKDPLKLDQNGCVNSHNQAVKIFNLQLQALSKRLQGQFPDANVTYVNIFSIKHNLVSNFSEYGFEHSITACCGYGGPPLNYDSRILCGQTRYVNGSSVTARPCNDTTEHVNWDGNHYTEAANLHVSSQILTGKYIDPPSLLNTRSFPFKLK